MKNDGDDTELQLTGDGSYTVVNKRINATYHSIHGAVTESLHVFIRNGFNQLQNAESIGLLEVGFGTGINIWLTMLETLDSGQTVSAVTIEPFPLPGSLPRMPDVKHNSNQNEYLWHKMHSADWNSREEIFPGFTLLKLQTTLQAVELSENYFDLVYFDAFAPSDQPELWTEAVFSKIFRALKPGGMLVTYCAKGDVKRAMKSAGFYIERLPGPPFKREMTRAVKKINSF